MRNCPRTNITQGDTGGQTAQRSKGPIANKDSKQRNTGGPIAHREIEEDKQHRDTGGQKAYRETQKDKQYTETHKGATDKISAHTDTETDTSGGEIAAFVVSIRGSAVLALPLGHRPIYHMINRQQATSCHFVSIRETGS